MADPIAPPAPRCLKCLYILTGLQKGQCPECGAPFDLDDRATFTAKPPFLFWRYWLPGLLLAICLGIFLYAIVVMLAGWGLAATLVVPFAIGSILGYGCRVRIVVQIILAIIAIGAIALGLFMMSMAGVFCTLVLAGVAFGPALIGMGVGAWLRATLRRSRFQQRDYLPVILAVLVPVIWADVEGQHHRNYAVETVSTSAIFQAPPDAAWDAVTFYEEVKLDPPWLLRLGLPRPLFATGPSRAPGDVKICVYTKGRLAKRVTRSVRGELLAFDVVRQHNIEDHDVRLTDGSFSFEPLPGGTAIRVTLTTRYEPLLGPRWVWRPFELLATRTLHEHVLNGMRSNLEAQKAMPIAPAQGAVNRAVSR
jgi:hypothetical protein